MFYKPEIREKLLLRRRRVDVVSKMQASTAIAAQCVQISQFLVSQHLGAYIAQENDGEIDTLSIINCAAKLNKKIYLPLLINQDDQKSGNLVYYNYNLGDQLIKNKYDIYEPDPRANEQFPIEKLDLIILPLVGFDDYGNRLGRGAGHYDRSLAFVKNQTQIKRPFLLGFAYEFQKIDKIEPSSWDVPLDMVITEKKIYPRIII